MIERRSFIKSTLIGMGSLSVAAWLSTLRDSEALAHPISLAPKSGEKSGAFSPLTALIILYPGCTHLDWVGPHMWISTLMNTTVDIVAKQRGLLVGSPGGWAVQIEKTFDDVEQEKYDIIFVPGGIAGTAECILDRRTVDFVRNVGGRATYVTSVCTGALILGAAGLLQGYKATTYWPVTHHLKDYGATFEDQRVVIDRNRITGGGVTAGIDFGLELTRQIRGDDFAKVSQLAIEYDPHPSLNSGSIKVAEPKIVSMAKSILEPGLKKIEAAVAATRPTT